MIFERSNILQFYLFAFLLTIGLVCNGQSQAEADLDALLETSKLHICRNVATADSLLTVAAQVAEKLELWSQKGYALKGLADNARCVGKFQEAIQLYDSAILYFESVDHTEGIVRCLNNLSGAEMKLAGYDRASRLLSRQVELSKALNNDLFLASAYSQLSALATLRYYNDSIIYYARLALELARNINNQRLMAEMTTSIGNAFFQNEDYQEALIYFREAAAIQLNSNQTELLASAYHNVGSAFTRTGQLDSAIFYLDSAIGINERISLTHHELGYNYLTLGDCYFRLGDFETAIANNLKSIQLSEQSGDKRLLCSALSNIAASYIELQEFDQAIGDAGRAISIAREIDFKDKESDAYSILSLAYERQGKYKEALTAYKQFYELDSAILGQEKSKQIATLQTQYETERKDRSIESLSQKAQIQELQISQRNTQLIAAMVFSFILILLGTLFYRQRKLRHLQAVSDLEQRMLRLQMNPHFIFNALASIQNYILQKDTKESVSYLAKFGKLMRQILEHSREESITIAEEVDMLHNYIDIQKLRFQNGFQYEIILEDSIDADFIMIPPLFAQPFVENAIEHGLKTKGADGKLTIRFQKNGDQVRIEIQDNGGGVQVSTEERKHRSLATVITKERLAILGKKLKSNFSLEVENVNQNGGTIARLSLPIIQ